jgi:peptide/nickel transport system substrate-binding protein
VWGLPPDEVVKLSGAGDPAKDKAEARRLLAAAGYGPGNPLKVSVATRSSAFYQDQASFIVDQLMQVGIEVTVEQIDPSVWHTKMSRREYQVAVNGYGTAVDDPDATFFEHFKCNSPRNWAGYCNEDVERLFEQQSQTLDSKKRVQLVHEIQRRLDQEGARPPLNWILTYVVMWPHVKNVVPHQSMYNYHRLQEAWIDK